MKQDKKAAHALEALGRRIATPTSYAPGILERVPRQMHTQAMEAQGKSYRRLGVDVWQAYEICCLYGDKIPAIGLLKLRYSAESRYIVESKSLKLYLNSLNAHLMPKARNASEALEALRLLVLKDLSELLEVDVSGTVHTERSEIDAFKDYLLLDKDPRYVHNGRILKDAPYGGRITADGLQEIKVCSQFLRTNCPVTGQPDWGTAFIHLRGNQPFFPHTLLRYLRALRDEQHFHEEVCDGLLGWLLNTYRPQDAMACCIYTRRGGIDISPIRTTNALLLPYQLMNTEIWTRPLLRQ